MIDFTIDARIARPPADVFAYVTDPAKLATWQTNTVSAEQIGDGPVGLGTRIREVHRAPGGRELPSVVEVSEFQPDRVFALTVVEGVPIHVRITFEPEGDGTLMRLHPHGRLTGLMRVAEPLIGRTIKRQFAGYCATLKDVLERS